MYIRLARETDLEAIVAIYNSTIDSRIATADTKPVSLESRLSWFRDRNFPCRPIWVVEREPSMGKSAAPPIAKLGSSKIINSSPERAQDNIAAWLSFNDFYGRPAYQFTAEISLYVAQDFRGQGIGDGLLKRAIIECPKLRIKTLLAFVFGHNLPSIKLFTKYEFTRWGFLPQVAEIDEIERDLLILGRRITS